VHIFSILLLFLIVNSSASAQQINAAIDNSFTYQGKLTADNAPANGSYDFEFKLYDALTNGSQVGSTVTKNAVTVADGLFSVQLNFGDVFDGSALFLQIDVREAGAGSYTTLDPRQALTAAPYALYSLEASQADTAQDFSGELAGDVTGEQDETVVTALQNQPITDTIPTTGQVLKYNGSQWQPDADIRHDYQGLIVVAKSGGDFNTITAALNSITDASDSNRYLVWVAPGTYAERVTMKSYVDIEGAGVLTTKISYTGSETLTGTIIGANHAELRSLTVENTGGDDDDYAIAIYTESTSPRLTNIILSASNGAFAYGMNNLYGDITMKNVNISAEGRIDSVGVKHSSCNETIMVDVDITAGDSPNSYGVETSRCNIVLKNVDILATASTNSYGVYNYNSDATINHSVIIAINTTNDSYGIYNYNESSINSVTINHSEIEASTHTILNDNGFTTGVGASKLSGGNTVNSGTLTCAGVYDESYTFYASTCP